HLPWLPFNILVFVPYPPGLLRLTSLSIKLGARTVSLKGSPMNSHTPSIASRVPSMRDSYLSSRYLSGPAPRPSRRPFSIMCFHARAAEYTFPEPNHVFI